MIEEAPSAALSSKLRKKMGEAAVKLRKPQAMSMQEPLNFF